MRLPRRLVAATLAAVLLPSIAPDARPDGEPDAPAAPEAPEAAVLVLKDGRRLEGEVLARTEGGVTFRSGGTTRFYASSSVESVTGAPVAPPPPPRSPETAGPPAGEPGPDRRARPPAAAAPARAPELSAAARSWIGDLARKASDPDESVRRSVAAALRALGPAAVPVIEEHAIAAEDRLGRELLVRVLVEIGSPRPREPGDAGPVPNRDAAREPGGDDPSRKPGFRAGLLEKLAADLDLRDDQRPAFAQLLVGMDRDAQQVQRAFKKGELAAADADARIRDLQTRIRAGAASILDEGQVAAFEPMLERYLGSWLDRISKSAGKSGDSAAPPAEPPAR